MQDHRILQGQNQQGATVQLHPILNTGVIFLGISVPKLPSFAPQILDLCWFRMPSRAKGHPSMLGIEYSIIRLYRTRLYRNSAYIEVQSAVPPDTMSIQKMIGYIKTWIYRSIHHGPLNFDITGLYCM